VSDVVLGALIGVAAAVAGAVILSGAPVGSGGGAVGRGYPPTHLADVPRGPALGAGPLDDAREAHALPWRSGYRTASRWLPDAAVRPVTLTSTVPPTVGLGVDPDVDGQGVPVVTGVGVAKSCAAGSGAGTEQQRPVPAQPMPIQRLVYQRDVSM
jgi:hypothetical protein